MTPNLKLTKQVHTLRNNLFNSDIDTINIKEYRQKSCQLIKNLQDKCVRTNKILNKKYITLPEDQQSIAAKLMTNLCIHQGNLEKLHRRTMHSYSDIKYTLDNIIPISTLIEHYIWWNRNICKETQENTTRHTRRSR